MLTKYWEFTGLNYRWIFENAIFHDFNVEKFLIGIPASTYSPLNKIDECVQSVRSWRDIDSFMYEPHSMLRSLRIVQYASYTMNHTVRIVQFESYSTDHIVRIVQYGSYSTNRTVCIVQYESYNMHRTVRSISGNRYPETLTTIGSIPCFNFIKTSINLSTENRRRCWYQCNDDGAIFRNLYGGLEFIEPTWIRKFHIFIAQNHMKWLTIRNHIILDELPRVEWTST